MWVLSFLAARGGPAAMLMIALPALVGPAPGLAGTPDARSDIVVVWDDHGSGQGHRVEHEVVDRSCHPDPSCSAAATPMTRSPIGTRRYPAVRQPLARITIRGRNVPVDLPPPRVRALSQPNSPNDFQT